MELRGSGEDLKSCFAQCRQCPAALPRNAFGRRFDGAGHERYGSESGVSYRLALRVIAMGDQNAVDIVQALRVDLLTSGGGVASSGLIRFKHALPHEGILEGLYIDDLTVTILARERELRSGFREDHRSIAAAHESYLASGLTRSPDKAFGRGAGRPGDSSFTAWGTHVRSSPGDAGTPAEKRLLLSGVILHAVNLKTIPRAVLDSILGLTVHPFMHRRELSACLHRVYKFLSDQNSEKLLVLPHDIRQELSYAALLLPLAKTNLRAQIDTMISATDATPSAGGAVSCTEPQVSRGLVQDSIPSRWS